MKSITKLQAEYEEQRKIATAANKKALRILTTIRNRQLKAMPSLSDIKTANEAERAKFGCLIHNGMTVKFTVEKLTKSGIIAQIKDAIITVTENETGKDYNIPKPELLPA